MKFPSFLLLFATVGTVCGFAPRATPSSTITASLASSTASSAETTTTEEKNMFGRFLDEEGLLKTSNFAIAPDALIERTRQVLSPEVGIGTKDNGACLADNFEFCAAVVGPIDKTSYLNALGSFNLEEAFDITANFYGFSVDPMQPNRVWFFNRVVGNHTGEFMGVAPTGKEVVYPPQVHHLDFNEKGLVTEYGFYTCDRRQGNTGGLGGAFGFMYAVGKPFPVPEGKPYKKSWQFRLLTWVGNFMQRRQARKNAK